MTKLMIGSLCFPENDKYERKNERGSIDLFVASKEK